MDEQKLAAIVVDAVKAAWDEDAHPRHPAGRSEGGKFAPKGGAGASAPPQNRERIRLFKERADRDYGNARKEADGDAMTIAQWIRDRKPATPTPSDLAEMDDLRVKLKALDDQLNGWEPSEDAITGKTTSERYKSVRAHAMNYADSVRDALGGRDPQPENWGQVNEMKDAATKLARLRGGMSEDSRGRR